MGIGMLLWHFLAMSGHLKTQTNILSTQFYPIDLYYAFSVKLPNKNQFFSCPSVHRISLSQDFPSTQLLKVGLPLHTSP